MGARPNQYLIRQGATYYACVEVPRPQRALAGQRRLKASLNTDSLTKANALKCAGLILEAATAFHSRIAEASARTLQSANTEIDAPLCFGSKRISLQCNRRESTSSALRALSLQEIFCPWSNSREQAFGQSPYTFCATTFDLRRAPNALRSRS